MMVMLGVTGHLGGSLTHGAGYLVISSVSDDAIKTDSSVRLPLTDSSVAAVYTAMVAPVLEQKCVACHQQKKMKGGLRMDGFDWLMKGGKSGVVVRPGDVAGSELIQRVLLPLEDDKHMPPKGKKQLSQEEIALLHWWVMKGADTLTKVKDVAMNDTLHVFLSGSGKKEMGMDTLPVIAFPDSMDLRQLKARGYGVRPLVSGSGWLDITAINVERLEAGDAPLLQKLGPQIWQMNLSGHELPESFANVLEVLIHTRRLDLRNAELSVGIRKKLDRLAALEYLNITGTDCTDEDLLPLLSLKNLRQVYGWKSGVSGASVQTFLQKRPDIKLDLGGK
jgi:mono/diheme cytochrome c family protein